MSNSEKWKLGNIEKAYAVGSNSGSVVKVNCPKLMPLIKVAKPSDSTKAISSKCFINHANCKVPISQTVNTRNYIKANVSGNNGFGGKLSFTHGMALQASTNNSDPDTLAITGREDKKIN